MKKTTPTHCIWLCFLALTFCSALSLAQPYDPSYEPDLSRDISRRLIGKEWRFRSVDYSEMFLRATHLGARVMTYDPNNALAHDFSFVIVPGLAGKGLSFQSRHYPNLYLHHTDQDVHLHENDGSEKFAKDASFIARFGFHNDKGYSFESVSRPRHFMRHRHLTVHVDHYNALSPPYDHVTWYVQEVERAKKFGDLTLSFTTEFKNAWENTRRGKAGAFWTPLPPEGFHALGSVARANRNDINGQVAALVVKDSSLNGDALAEPVDFMRIWLDKDSGSSKNGSCWRPIAPEGFVALGDVFVEGYDPPSLNSVMCVNRDLVYPATIGDLIWDDKGTRVPVDFSAWQLTPAPNFANAETGLIAPNTFVAVDSHERPVFSEVAWVLNLPFPQVAYEEPPSPPRLDGYNPPADDTPPQLDREVWVPFTGITDDTFSTQWKVDHSPFYRVQRLVSFHKELWAANPTGQIKDPVTEQVTTGVSASATNEFQQSVGISVEATAGVALLGASVTTTITTELGWSQSSTNTTFEERSLETVVRPEPYSAAVVWSTLYTIRVERSDGSSVSQMSFSGDDFYLDAYPRD